jgi:hypothetical protein
MVKPHWIWLRKTWVVWVFVVVNLALAAPAMAGWKNTICHDPEGGKIPCCEACIFFCGCDLIDDTP